MIYTTTLRSDALLAQRFFTAHTLFFLVRHQCFRVRQFNGFSNTHHINFGQLQKINGCRSWPFDDAEVALIMILSYTLFDSHNTRMNLIPVLRTYLQRLI